MIELIAIGKELLEGSTVDTNAAYVGQVALEHGWDVSRKTTIDDVPDVIGEVVLQALQRSDVVITTGGLGDTHDDVTVEAIERAVSGKKEALNNRVGQAPGVCFLLENKMVFCLPGVPTEMRTMFLEQVVPRLEKKLPREFERQLLHLILTPESTVSIEGDGIGKYPKYGTLTLAFRGKAISMISEVEKEFPDKIFSYDDPRIEVALQKLMIKKGLTLATAESCTGGKIASTICAVPDASQYFVGSVVSYANAVKEQVLSVKSFDCGSVSEEVVKEMAEGLLKITGASYGIAVTGIAGPSGGTEEKPVGTVWCAIATAEGEMWTGLVPRLGGPQREKIIEFTKNYVLANLWRYLEHGIIPFERLYPN